MDATASVETSQGPIVYVHDVDVTDDDIDALGHASNIAYVRWIQDAAIAHSTSVGLDVETYCGLGACFVVCRHEVDYLRPVLRGDRLEVRTWLDSVMAAKSLRATEIVRVAGEKPLLVARAKTTWGFMEMSTGRPRRIPDDIRIAFGQAPRSRMALAR